MTDLDLWGPAVGAAGFGDDVGAGRASDQAAGDADFDVGAWSKHYAGFVPVHDTGPGAKTVQRAALASMTTGDRMLAAMAMADDVKQITLAGIRMRNPDFDEKAVHRAWFTILHGPEMTIEILGPDA